MTLRKAGDALVPLWQGVQAASSSAFRLRGPAALSCPMWQLEQASAATVPYFPKLAVVGTVLVAVAWEPVVHPFRKFGCARVGS